MEVEGLVVVVAVPVPVVVIIRVVAVVLAMIVLVVVVPVAVIATMIVLSMVISSLPSFPEDHMNFMGDKIKFSLFSSHYSLFSRPLRRDIRQTTIER